MTDPATELREFIRRTVADMVAIPSPSGKEAAMADYVFARLRDAGMAPERDQDDNVWVQTGSGRSRLEVNAHMDTVVPVDGWVSDPFKARIEGDRLYGLGAADCKAGLAAMLWLAPRVKPRARVRFSFTVCEEGFDLPKTNGSERMASQGGDWAIVCEPTCRDGKAGIGTGTQGHVRAWVTFRGRAAHSSRPEDGDNAITKAANFCAELDKLNASFPETDVGGGSPPRDSGAQARGTAAATMIAGGKLSNIIPDKCDVTVSRRLAPGESAGTFDAELKRLLSGKDAEYTIASDGAGALTLRDGILLKTVRQAAAGLSISPRENFFRGRTDAVIYARHGMDTLMLGPGDDTQCHVANEYLDLTGAVIATQLLESLINSLPDKSKD